jgi:hypothetical protein
MVQLGYAQAIVLNNKMDNVLFNLYSGFSIIPTIVGIFNFKKLDLPIKMILYISLSANILMVISNILAFQKNANTHFLFYFYICFFAIFYSLFFKIILLEYKKIILVFPLFIGMFLLFDLMQTGKKEMNILPYIFIDVFILICSLKYLSQPNSYKLSFRKIVILLLIFGVYDIIFNFLTSYFYQYLSEGIYKLMWFWVNPIVGIVYYVFLAYFIYLSVEKYVPDFDKVFDTE